jgi:TetR/AcrR family transcriptional regulator, regulator of autoinduction and epiphytic fitness
VGTNEAGGLKKPTARTSSARQRNSAPLAPHRTVGDGGPRIDGRLARSQRTIEHIVQAILELLERDGDLRPTAHQVARRAGVSRRALYLHFDSLEELFAIAAQRRAAEVCGAWEPPAAGTPLDTRIHDFTYLWSTLCEDLLPLRKAAAIYEPFSVAVASTFDRARRWARSTTELVFLPELAARAPAERASYRTALHHITSWSGWDDLRRQGAQVETARATLQLLLTRLLTA